MNDFKPILILILSIIALTYEQTDIYAVPRALGLAAHNKYRTIHHAKNQTLDTTINSVALNYSKYLAANSLFQHSGNTNYGENLYRTCSYPTSPNFTSSIVNATTSWYNEVTAYNYSNPGFSAATGHFTQLVWNASILVGFGAANGTYLSGGIKFNCIWVVANYKPPGNYLGQFAQNVFKP